MPRKTTYTPPAVEFLSILDEDGQVDAKLEPKLPQDFLRRLHDAMLLARRFDERMLSLQRQGRIGTFAPVKGQEAAQVGAAAVLSEQDWVVPSFRETAALVWRGLPLEGVLLYNAGYNEGGRVPDGQNFLPPSVPVGSQMLHAAGLAYGGKLKKSGAIVLTFFGDGATSEGDFHEALNFASVLACPVIFLCQNNHYAISMPRAKQTSSRTLAQKAIAYEMPCLQVDGNDVLAVYVAAKEAAERARAENRPTLIECVTYRLSVHTTVDDPSKYRSEEEVKTWERRDPLSRFQTYLRNLGMLAEKDVEAAEEAVSARIKTALHAWEDRMASLTDPAVMFEHLYASKPPALKEQQDRFVQEWSTRGEGARHG
ncbi:pyruvate dehydrogenase (acetyl-transferring) E1 component subunit alpha [Nitrospira sp.]|nr:pyruvate dehydrogenase (acetyl-transferring) E1 component subunit alpha [Nitrospira sp.]